MSLEVLEESDTEPLQIPIAALSLDIGDWRFYWGETGLYIKEPALMRPSTSSPLISILMFWAPVMGDKGIGLTRVGLARG